MFCDMIKNSCAGRKRTDGEYDMKYLKKQLLAVLFLCMLFGAVPCHAAEQQNVISSAVKVSNGKWVVNEKGRRYQAANGKYLKNIWLNVSGQIYRLNAEGYCRTGWFVYSGKKYFAGKNGALYCRQWYTENGATYYLSSAGSCVTSKWVKWHGNYRYLQADGRMAVSCWVGDYYVGPEGVRLKNCVVGNYWLNDEGKKTIKVSSFRGNYIFVGDSRTDGMSEAVTSSDVLFIAKRGSGYDWLSSEADETLRAWLNARPDVTVVLAHGINDLENIGSYITYYKKLIAQYPKAKIYVMSVNPVNLQLMKEKRPTAYAKGITNATITSFNKKLKKAFGERYIDTYSYLSQRGFTTTDGVHYPNWLYKDIYRYVIKKIK
jgi:hypothetical protein